MADATENDGIDRRSFLRRAGIAGVFGIPLITTFGMTGMGDAFAGPPNNQSIFGNQPSHVHGNQPHCHHGNQHQRGNQPSIFGGRQPV